MPNDTFVMAAIRTIITQLILQIKHLDAYHAQEGVKLVKKRYALNVMMDTDW